MPPVRVGWGMAKDRHADQQALQTLGLSFAPIVFKAGVPRAILLEESPPTPTDSFVTTAWESGRVSSTVQWGRWAGPGDSSGQARGGQCPGLLARPGPICPNSRSTGGGPGTFPCKPTRRPGCLTEQDALQDVAAAKPAVSAGTSSLWLASVGSIWAVMACALGPVVKAPLPVSRRRDPSRVPGGVKRSPATPSALATAGRLTQKAGNQEH